MATIDRTKLDRLGEMLYLSLRTGDYKEVPWEDQIEPVRQRFMKAAINVLALLGEETRNADE